LSKARAVGFRGGPIGSELSFVGDIYAVHSLAKRPLTCPKVAAEKHDDNRGASSISRTRDDLAADDLAAIGDIEGLSIGSA
jgi:hypothetical protein